MKLSTGKIAAIYIGSVLLSPFGLYWFFKYLRDPETKVVAYVSLILTVSSFAIATVVTGFYIKSLNSYLAEYKKSMDVYSQLGY